MVANGIAGYLKQIVVIGNRKLNATKKGMGRLTKFTKRMGGKF